CFLSVLDRVDKQEALVTLMNSVQRGASSVRCFLHDPNVFSVLPKKRIAYWCSEGWLRNFSSLAVQPRQFVVTTKSDYKLEVYLNLARRMKLTGVDQLWVADITYIRLKTEFVYLAVILDGFSRKVVGWSLSRTLASCLAVAALQEAIATRKPPPGLVHHSDRGVQYASEEYVAVLEKQGMILS